MTTLNLGRVVGQDGEDGRGIVSIEKTATAGLVDTYTITYTDGTTSTFDVTNGQDGTGGGQDYTDLTNKPSINDVTLEGNKSLSELGAQATLTSGTNIKTINNQSILGSGNITIEGGEPNYEDPVLSNSAFEITDEDDNVLFAVSNTGAIKTKAFDSDDLNGGQEYDIDYVLRNGEWGSNTLTWYPNIVCNSVRIKGPFKIATSDGYILYSAYSYTNKLDTDFTGAAKVLTEDTTRTSWSYTGNDYVGFNLISAEGVGSNLTILEPLYSAISMLKSTNIKDNTKKEGKEKAIRNAIFLGDSITHGVYSYFENGIEDDAHRYCAWYWNRTYKTMPDYFSEYSGACVNNAAARGSGYVIEGRYRANGNNVSGQGPFYGNTNRKKEAYDFANYDFVGVMEGINDYIQQANLGTPPASNNESWTPTSGTVTGNLGLLIQKIISDNPLCKIVIYSPYNSWGQVAKGDSSKGGYSSNETYGTFEGDYALGYTKRTYTLSDLVEAIDKVCKYYHVEHIKLSESNICNRLSIKDIMIEGLHSSLESMPKLAAEVFADKGYGE